MNTTARKPRKKRERGPRGFGTVRYREDKNAWEVRISWTVPGTGKRKYKSAFFDTEKEAITAQPMLAARYSPGAIDRMEDVTFKAYLGVWLDGKKREWAPGTYRTQETYVRVHILGDHSRLGAIELRAIGERDVKHFLDTMQDRNVGASTRASVLTTLKNSLGDAQKHGYTTSNAAENVTAPKVEKTPKTVLTFEQVKRVLDVADEHPMGSLIRFLIDTGCRVSEAFALSWDDVHENHVIIHRSLSKGHDGKLYRKSTKANDNRRVVLEPETMFALRRIDRTKTNWENLVWANSEGNPLDQSHFRKRVADPIFKAAKVPKGFTPHGFRRTAATLQFQQGADLVTIKARGGWKTDRMVTGVYAQATDEGQNRLVETMAGSKRDDKDDGMRVSTPSLVIGKSKPKKVG